MDKERSGERMKLGAFFQPTGNHVAAWLHPDAQIDAGTNFRHYADPDCRATFVGALRVDLAFTELSHLGLG